jgi:hypothetical protein
MWVKTQEDELVNLGNIEYIRIEEDEEGEEGGGFELRAYAFGWEPDDAEDEYYPLASAPDRESVDQAMDRLMVALAQGVEFLDLRGSGTAPAE